MPALNFKKQFAGAVKSGHKRQTIRATRKSPIRQGDILYLYTGMRTKNCKKLREVMCKDVSFICIWPDKVSIDRKIISKVGVLQLAKNDGFKNTDEFFKFFSGELHHLHHPFMGQIMYW